MIVGSVNSRYELVVEVTIRDENGFDRLVPAVLDTGFNGVLTLPAAEIASLGLAWHSRIVGTLADGRTETFLTYIANVRWDGHTKRIIVTAMETTPLLGIALLAGYDLKARVEIGGDVEITRIP